MRVISCCCTYLNHHPSILFLFFLHTSTGQTPGPMLMVDGSNGASWLKEVSFGYEDANKILLGVHDSKTVELFEAIGKSQLKR